eukprot:6211265-Pleurochrysis_carterae.AAC.1
MNALSERKHTCLRTRMRPCASACTCAWAPLSMRAFACARTCVWGPACARARARAHARACTLRSAAHQVEQHLPLGVLGLGEQRARLVARRLDRKLHCIAVAVAAKTRRGGRGYAW